MNAAKFRIKNYKSIDDSGYCYLDEKVTILAGKNEAGKTVILEALEDFGSNRAIRKEAVPIWDQSRLPEICISFILNTEDIHKIRKEFEIKIPQKEINLEITKRYPNSYFFSEESLIRITANLESTEDIKKDIAEIIASINEKVEDSPFNLDLLNDPQQLYTLSKDYEPEFTVDIYEEERVAIEEKITILKTLAKKLSDSDKFQSRLLEFVGRISVRISFCLNLLKTNCQIR